MTAAPPTPSENAAAAAAELAARTGIDRHDVAVVLGSGWVPAIDALGPAVAEHMVNVFGMDILDVLNNHPERLVEVPGMGARKAESIAGAWSERRSLQGF